MNASPTLSILKTASEASFSSAGNQIHYTITVTNTGAVTLTNISVTDPLTNLTSNIANMAPGNNRTFSTIYTVVAGDISAGQVVNTATASYTFGSNNYTETARHTVPAILTGNEITISKSASSASFSYVSEVITYTIRVTNSGNVTLTNILVSDPLTGLYQTISSLAPGADRTFTPTYSITQNDINRGYVNNTAIANYNFGGNPYSESASVQITASLNPGLNLSKSASLTSYSSVGQTLTYTIILSNTGNVTLTSILVTDPLTGLSRSVSSLTPGHPIR